MVVVATASPGGPEALQVREVEDLPAPGEGEVLVGVAAAGVNRGDTVQWQGRYPPPRPTRGSSAPAPSSLSGPRWAVGTRCARCLPAAGMRRRWWFRQGSCSR